MSFSKLLSRAAHTIPISAMDDVALAAFDKQLMAMSKKPGLGQKALDKYTKLLKPAYLPNQAVYGSKLDATRLAVPMGLTAGKVTFGGKAATPFLNTMNALYAKMAPTIAATTKAHSGTMVANNLAMLKPGIAAGNMVGLGAGKALGAIGAGKAGTALTAAIAGSPLLGSAAIPLGGMAALGGSKALLSRLGRARRLKLLRKGLMPTQYSSEITKQLRLK